MKCDLLISHVLFSLWNTLKASRSNRSLIPLTRRTAIAIRVALSQSPSHSSDTVEWRDESPRTQCCSHSQRCFWRLVPSTKCVSSMTSNSPWPLPTKRIRCRSLSFERVGNSFSPTPLRFTTKSVRKTFPELCWTMRVSRSFPSLSDVQSSLRVYSNARPVHRRTRTNERKCPWFSPSWSRWASKKTRWTRRLKRRSARTLAKWEMCWTSFSIVSFNARSSLVSKLVPYCCSY